MTYLILYFPLLHINIKKKPVFFILCLILNDLIYRNFIIFILIILVIIALCKLKKERISKCPFNYLQVTVTYLILYSPLKKKGVYLLHQLIILLFTLFNSLL